MGGKFNVARLRKYVGNGTIQTLSASNTSTTLSGAIGVGMTEITASGSNQSTAAPLTAGSYFYLVGSDSAAKGVILQSDHAVMFKTVIVANNASSASFKLYPPVSGTIGSGSANTHYVVAPGMAYQLFCYGTSPAQWVVLGNVNV